ncbi:Thymidylate kinase [Savitreella phatthalungensis]
MPARGRLIVVEGLDRSGKTTQCARLRERLANTRGTGCLLLKFPDRTTTIGLMIDSYLRSQTELDDRAIHLLFSANRWEKRSAILDALEHGTDVILDRYVYSGVAFSTVKGLDAAWCRSCDQGLPRPDLIIFLDIDTDSAARRGGYGEERYEKAAIQSLVREAFKELQAAQDDVQTSWCTIDARYSVDEVQEAIWKQTELLLEKEALEPIGKITWTSPPGGQIAWR